MKNISLKEKDREEYQILNRVSLSPKAVSIVSRLLAFLPAIFRSLIDQSLYRHFTLHLVTLVPATAGSQPAKVYRQKKERNGPV